MTETVVREYPILFSAPMIRAILNGTKTQARYAMHPQPEHVWGWGVKPDEHDFTAHVRYPGGHPPDPWVRCPYGAPPHRGCPGDGLWVRETWRQGPNGIEYRADDDRHLLPPWKPSVYMPRWASRITLEIASIRVERLQDITEEDAEQEGTAAWAAAYCSQRPEDELYARAYFELMWRHGEGKRYSWDSNPFCWVLVFQPAPTRGREGGI